MICAGVALAGAWTDRTKVVVEQRNGATPASKPWAAMVEISRHGRRLDGFRPVLTITGLGTPKSFQGSEVSSGRDRVRVVFPRPGFYTYTVKVANQVAARGAVYAYPE